MDERTEQQVAEQVVRAGFTLIEIIIAIAIVGIMAAVAVPNVSKYIDRANKTAARSLVDTAKQATMTYKLDHSGKAPDSQDAWVEAITGGEDPEISGGPDALNDPWGTPLRYQKLGKNNRFLITSAGPDGEFDTDDDILSEEKKK